MRIRLAIAAAGLLLVPPADAAGAYSGHVRDPLGQPIAGATVRAGLIVFEPFAYVFRTSAQSTTAADGSYLLTTPDDGSYILVASGAERPTVMYPDHPCRIGDVCLDAVANGVYAIPPAVGVDFTLPRAASISGRILSPGTPPGEEQPIVGSAGVGLHATGSAEYTALPFAEGRFRFDRLWPGAYKLCASSYEDPTLLPQCYGSYGYDDFNAAQAYADAAVIDVAEGDSSAITMTAQRASYIAGALRSAIDGAPLTSGVYLRRAGDADYAWIDDYTASYSLKVAPGDFEIGFEQSDWYTPLYPLQAITVGADETVTVDAALQPRATMAGTVVDAQTRQPLAGVQVVARSDEAMWPAIATTDAGGHFLVQGVGAGMPYRLRTEGAPAHVDVAYPDTIASPFATFDTITLANDEQRGGLDLALPRGGWVSGRIHDAYTDAPVAGAIVRIVQNGGEWGANTTSDANGRYATSAVPAGTYNVVVQLPSTTYLWPATPCADPWSCNATAANAIAIDDTTEQADHDLALPGTDVILRSGFE